MKRAECLIVVLIAAMPGVVKAEEPVYFADANLNACVEATLGITDPTPTDMLGLTSLGCTYSGIVDLTGLEYATNLTELYLRNNQISDISALSGLTNLTRLWLNNTQISDISALSGLTNLTRLWLNNNQISDISAVAGLTNLTYLHLGGNQISDISTVAGLTNLTYLHLGGNQISDISAVSGLTNLSVLDLSYNPISDISALSGLTNLRELTLWENHISDISALSGLTNLTELWLTTNPISDISALSGLTNLTYLHLHDNQISDISAVAGLTNMRELHLHYNQISDISALAGLTNLEWLRLDENKISDISALAGLTNLRKLRLPGNQISDISAVADLTNLFWLYLQNNQISDISALSGLTNLKHLRLHDNQISDISAVAGLTNLVSLWLQDNPLNQDACDIYIPQILQNNQGIDIRYDPCVEPPPPVQTLTISSMSGGSVTVPGEGSFEYEHGQEITLEAEAEPGYHFTHWSGNLWSTDNPVNITMDHDYHVTANFAIKPIIIYVDDNAPNDPEQNNPAISDPNEDGSAKHPFDMIQEGIDAALDGETVIVRDGTYREAIEFAGRNITVTGFEPNEPNAILPYPVIDANYIGTAVTFCHKEEPNCILEGFVITRGAGEVAGGINCVGSSPTISHCLIVGNRVMDPNGGRGAVFCIDSNAVFENCTFSGNYGGEQGAGLYLYDSNAVLLNCIVWDNLPYQIAVACGLDPNITFSDVQDTWPGQGNIDIAPCFAELGYWADANNQNIAVEPSEANAVWVGGDYHLKSQAGRWEPYSASWVIDDVTSLCIDAGDPNSDWIAELWPHGKRINMGAYGGTPQASTSLSTVADPLSEALDTALSFTTGGSADWFSQTKTSYHDVDAAQSGDTSDDQESWMQTTVSGKGTVKFYWKVSSGQDYDFLEFYIDGVLQDQISGSVDYWVQKTYTISTSGSHVLEWRYIKDGATSFGDDCGWVDKIEWVTN